MIKEGNFEGAIGLIAIAFSKLLRDFETKGKSSSRHSPYAFGESFSYEPQMLGILKRSVLRNLLKIFAEPLLLSRKD